MNRFLFIILILFSLIQTAEAQEKLYINHSNTYGSIKHNIYTNYSNSRTNALSIIATEELFQQSVFAELRYESLNFYDQFNNEYHASYLSLGVGPRFSLFKYFTYDIGLYMGFLLNSKAKMIRNDFPTRSLTEGKIMAIQRLTYGINVFSNVSLNIQGEIQHHFNNLIQDFIWGESGQSGYEVSYNLGIGLSYQFGK